MIKEILDKIKGIAGGEEEEEGVEMDDVTKDKYLRSLRRQRRTQMEEIEKEKLIKDIGEFNKERTRKHLFGIKDKMEKKKELIEAFNKKQKVNILKKQHSLLSQGSLLNNRKEEFKKKSGNLLSTDGILK